MIKKIALALSAAAMVAIPAGAEAHGRYYGGYGYSQGYYPSYGYSYGYAPRPYYRGSYAYGYPYSYRYRDPYYWRRY